MSQPSAARAASNRLGADAGIRGVDQMFSVGRAAIGGLVVHFVAGHAVGRGETRHPGLQPDRGITQLAVALRFSMVSSTVSPLAWP